MTAESGFVAVVEHIVDVDCRTLAFVAVAVAEVSRCIVVTYCCCCLKDSLYYYCSHSFVAAVAAAAVDVRADCMN